VNTLKVTEKDTTVHSGCYFSSACYSPDGKYLATGEWNTNSGTSTVRIWDASNGQEYAKYNHGSCIYLFNLLIINYYINK
jgi:WD40 repeat protein